MRSRRGGMAAVAGLLAVTLAGSTAFAQRRRGFGFRGFSMNVATPDSFDGSFQFCRVIQNESPDGDGGGWSVDYPRADINLSIRLSELTRTRVSRDTAGEPNHLLIRLTDDTLFQCPFIMMTEVGSI